MGRETRKSNVSWNHEPSIDDLLDRTSLIDSPTDSVGLLTLPGDNVAQLWADTPDGSVPGDIRGGIDVPHIVLLMNFPALVAQDQPVASGGSSSTMEFVEYLEISDNVLNDYLSTAAIWPDVFPTSAAALATDIPTGVETTATLAVGQNVSSDIGSAGDQDWFKIGLEAGKTYRFHLDGDWNGQTGLQPQLRLMDSNGYYFSWGNGQDTGSGIVEFTPQSSGDYFLAARGYGGTSTGTYTLSATYIETKPLYTIEQIADHITTLGGQVVARHWAEDTTDNNPNVHKTISYSVAGFSAYADWQDLARKALAAWGEVCGLEFVESDANPLVRFKILPANVDQGAYASLSYNSQSGIINSVDVNFGAKGDPSSLDGTNSGTMDTLIHELGHALGFRHDYNTEDGRSYADDTVFANDTEQYSVLSYFNQNSYGVNSAAWAVTPQLADIYAAIQLYGAGVVRQTNTAYGFNASGQNAVTRSIYDFTQYVTGATSTAPPGITIYDTGGIDILDVSGYSMDQRIDLRPGTWSDVGGARGNIGIYLDTIIENATGGSGDDDIVGNSADNVLSGGGGNDRLDGMSGADVLNGGNGDDALWAGSGNDSLNGGAGADKIYGSTGNDVIDGGEGDDPELKGQGGDDMIEGGLGNDKLYGREGSDRLYGEDGNDDLFGDQAGYLQGDDYLYGGAGDDYLYGGGGNDILYGGEGADTLSGGDGGDRASYLDATTRVKVNLGDPSQNTGDAAADSYSSIEYLTGTNFGDSLQADSGNNRIGGADGNDVINGMAGNDVLSGNAGNDRIYGHLGTDTLEGGVGNDTFIFHQAFGANNIDTITDFGSGADIFELWSTVFTTLSAGTLGASAFKDIATAAKDANDRIIYDSGTGVLSYDADGSGVAFSNVQFVLLANKPTLTANDFLVV